MGRPAPVLAGLVVLIAAAGLTLGPQARQHAEGLAPPWWWLTAVVCFIPLAWRRRWPPPVFAVIAASAIAILSAGVRQLAGTAFVALWLALYSVAARDRAVWRWRRRACSRSWAWRRWRAGRRSVPCSPGSC